MNILDKIITYKTEEVKRRKEQISIAVLEKREGFKRPTFSLADFLTDDSKTGIIAEFKRKSPSKGIINDKADVLTVTKGYTQHGASCLSVLTDEYFFGGSDEDLMKARQNDIPILRKDFIIDEYQIIEAKSIGADVILLIAACLSPKRVKALATLAKQSGLSVLLELHDEDELNHICDETDIIGINNRNLKTFAVDIKRSLRMAERIPASKIKVAESGISSPENIRLFKQNGFSGFLIGENFMKETEPAVAFARFVHQLKQNQNLHEN